MFPAVAPAQILTFPGLFPSSSVPETLPEVIPATIVLLSVITTCFEVKLPMYAEFASNVSNASLLVNENNSHAAELSGVVDVLDVFEIHL